MRLPAYWWLLGLALLGQGGFFVRRGALRLRGAGWPPLTQAEAVMLGSSGAAGLAYGAVQSDPVFVAGQLCLLIIYYRMRREPDDG